MKIRSTSLLRIFLMMSGIFLIGICVACYRLSCFGVDSFTGMNLGISSFIGFRFGTWQLIANILILIVVFFTVPHCIGPGTIVNMICVGYISDFICWVINDAVSLKITLPIQIIFLLLGTLFASLGVALYMKADMGISPYDSVALILIKLTKNKLSFRIARISSDLTALIIGVFFCIVSHHNIWTIIGIGTIFNSLFNGPFIQLFQRYLEKIFRFEENFERSSHQRDRRIFSSFR